MIFAIGDIHGHCAKLVRLLELLTTHGLSPEDTLVFVGDYVDRGPNVKGVLDALIALKASRPNTVFLRGNHEQLLLDARATFDRTFDADNTTGDTSGGVYWFPEGGAQTMASYGSIGSGRWFEKIPEAHWQFIRSTTMEFEISGYLFVHAGIVPHGKTWSMEQFDADPRLWIRYEFIASDSDFGGRTVIFGHTPTRDEKPMIMKNKVAIDTGAGYGGPLTAVRLPEPYAPDRVEVFQVST